jgi:glycosyltransferase involved in cell wall biosynthesis
MITYAITTHNEGKVYLTKLISQIKQCKGRYDEVIILDDNSTDAETCEILASCGLPVIQHDLNNDFATHKNQIAAHAKGDYIFQIDGDEFLGVDLADTLPELLFENPDVDMFYVPRVNIVEGLTHSDALRWNWRVDDKNRVMWPDYQTRIYKNNGKIYWKNAVHEVLTSNYDIVVGQLPEEETWALHHHKDILRQRQQNEFYATIK